MTVITSKLGLLIFGIALFMSNVYSPPSSFQHITDECDWVASSALGTPQRSIRPVYLRCSQGRIEWKYPRGALRVVLRLGTSGKDFKGCVKAGLHFQGAHLYLEGHRTLHLLYSPSDGRHPQLPRCFASRSGQVALYVEAENLSGVEAGVVEFNYHLEPRWPWKLTRGEEAKKLTSDLEADCKPCQDEDLIQLYCTSDFAVRGRMLYITDNHQLERTELKVTASKIYKQNAAVFQQKSRKHPMSSSLDTSHRSPPSLAKSHHQVVTEPTHHQSHHHHHHHPPFHQGANTCSGCLTDTAPWMGVVHFPLECGVKFGSGEFMFLGRLLLGCPVVMCAPRWEDWLRVWTAAASQGAMQCTIP